MSKKKIRRPQQYQKPKTRTLKEWWLDQTEATKKKLMYACVAVVAVIALALIWYYAIYDDGSLKIKDNAAVAAQDNWLVGQRTGGKNSNYYHIADVSAPEGYTLSETNVSGSGPRTDFTYTAQTEKGEMSLYVAPVSYGVQDMINSIYVQFSAMMGEKDTISEILEYKDCKYFVYTMQYDGDDGATNYSQSLVLYTPGNYSDTCILVSASPTVTGADGFWANEDLLTEAVKALDAITLAKK